MISLTLVSNYETYQPILPANELDQYFALKNLIAYLHLSLSFKRLAYTVYLFIYNQAVVLEA